MAEEKLQMGMIAYTIDTEGIATIRLDRDGKRNSLNQEMAAQLLNALEQAETDGARVVILRANAGVKVWCAGHDLADLDPQDLHAENPTLEVARTIQLVPFPVIAMVEGSVHGGGLIILLSADLVIAADSVSMSIASNKLGIPLSPELLAFWLRVMGIHRAKELLFTATTISAKDAYQAGYFNHIVEPQGLETVTLEVARRITECSSDAIASTKQQLNLLARKTALSDEEYTAVATRTSEILNSQETSDRIVALLAGLGR